jgi:hypothetical protein
MFLKMVLNESKVNAACLGIGLEKRAAKNFVKSIVLQQVLVEAVHYTGLSLWLMYSGILGLYDPVLLLLLLLVVYCCYCCCCCYYKCIRWVYSSG